MVELYKCRTRILLKRGNIVFMLVIDVSDLKKLSEEIRAVEELIWSSDEMEIESINLRMKNLD